MTLKINITEPNTLKLLLDSIEGYRGANEALDEAVEKENWGRSAWCRACAQCMQAPLPLLSTNMQILNRERRTNDRYS